MVESIAAAAGTQTPSKADKSEAKLAKDMDQFMNLLTTQLKHQDPMEPMKAEEFTNQLVKFASVEQQIHTNKSMETLIEMQANSQSSNSVNFLGKTVSFGSKQLPVQDGSGTFQYSLPEATQSTSIVIRDGSGRVVTNLEGRTDSGTHEVTWDGTDDYGNQLADGTYSVSVNGTTQDGRFVKGETTVEGTVTDVFFEKEGTTFAVGDTPVSLEDIKAVRTAS